MKTWHIYTLIGLAGCMVFFQVWSVLFESNRQIISTESVIQQQKKPALTQPRSTRKKVTYTKYYWDRIPKILMDEDLVFEEVRTKEKNKETNDPLSAFADAHELEFNGEYVGTLCETENDVIVLIKYTYTDYIDMEQHETPIHNKQTSKELNTTPKR